MAKHLAQGVFISIPLLFTLALLGIVDSIRVREEPGIAASAPGEPPPAIELRLWSTWVNNSAWEKTIIDTIRSFERQNPGIRISIAAIPHDEYKIKVKAAAAGRELPDMLVVWPGAELQPLVEGQTLQPIDDIAEAYRAKLIPERSMDDYKVGGKQYAIPVVANYTSIIYYDRELLHRLGYDQFPATYDQFRRLIGDIKNAGIVPIALGNRGKWVLQSSYLSTIASRFTGDDYLADVLSGKRKFTDPDFVSAIQVIDELNRMNAFNDDKNKLDDTGQLNRFVQGESAMVISGSWALPQISERYPKDKSFGLAVFPAVGEGDGGGRGDMDKISGVTGQGIALNANLTEEKRSAAIMLLQSIHNETTYRKLLQVETLVPASIDVPPDVTPLFKQMSELVHARTISPVYDAVLPTKLTDLVNQSLFEMTTDTRLTPIQVAAALQAQLDAIRKEQYDQAMIGRVFNR
ncbi:extracellular solute-binding protein [Paenibacillus chartarius]|uniref:Extracellular solute-binding protein n=1 Tax=Paenibacillus chartarius TaxID=747481 RepID=A0ABV6DRU4_9BACL